jgi:hypothetical protein
MVQVRPGPFQPQVPCGVSWRRAVASPIRQIIPLYPGGYFGTGEPEGPVLVSTLRSRFILSKTLCTAHRLRGFAYDAPPLLSLSLSTEPTSLFADVIHISFVNMNNSIQRSIGQGSLFPRSTLSTHQSSIVRGLTTRSIRGRGLAVEVHQHHGFNVHLIWHFTHRYVTSEACLARNLLSYRNVLGFANEVERWTLEGKCTCLCAGDMHYIWDKVNLCFRVPPLHSA